MFESLKPVSFIGMKTHRRKAHKRIENWKELEQRQNCTEHCTSEIVLQLIRFVDPGTSLMLKVRSYLSHLIYKMSYFINRTP